MIIELGDVSAPTGRARESAPLPDRTAWMRSGKIVLLVVLAMVIGAATVVRSPDQLPRVADLPIGSSAQLLVREGQALVLDTDAGHSRLTAYAMPGGHRSWTAPVTAASGSAYFAVVDGAVIVAAPAPGSDTSVAEGFDARTGTKLWSAPTTSIAEVDAGLLIDSAAGPSTVVALVNPRTGGHVWTMTVPAGCETSIAGDAAATDLVELCDQPAELSVFALATGARLAVHGLTFLPDAGRGGSLTLRSRLLFVGGVTLITDSNDLFAFRTADLALLWQLTLDDSAPQVQTCAPDVCILSGTGVGHVDPVSGNGVAPPAAAETVLSASDFSTGRGVTTLVVLPAAVSLVSAPAAAEVDLQHQLPYGTAVELLAPAGGSTWITELVTSGDTPRLRPLRFLRDVGDGCVVISRYVACTVGSRLTFWQLPSSWPFP